MTYTQLSVDRIYPFVGKDGVKSFQKHQFTI
jgi:hypothetical protein